MLDKCYNFSTAPKPEIRINYENYGKDKKGNVMLMVVAMPTNRCSLLFKIDFPFFKKSMFIKAPYQKESAFLT